MDIDFHQLVKFHIHNSLGLYLQTTTRYISNITKRAAWIQIRSATSCNLMRWLK